MKKLLSIKKYEFILKQYDDDSTELERINDGFNILEILGLANLISFEMKDIIQGTNVKVDTIERKVVEK
jgi:hypothetical protein